MFTKNIEVRKLTVNDREEVAKIDDKSRCLITNFVNIPYYYCYGVFAEKKLVGYCMLHMATECYWIDDLYIIPSERNLGLGSLLACMAIKKTFDDNGKKPVNISRNADKFRPFFFSLGITYDVSGPCWWESVEDFSYDSLLRYPIGATIELVHGIFIMCPPSGTRGRITSVNKYTVNVDWEGGYDYTINLTADIIRIVDRYDSVNKAAKNLLKENNMFIKGQLVWYFNANEIKTAKYEKDIPNSSIVEMRDDSQFNWQCYTTKDHVFATEEECREAFENRPGVWILTASGDDASAVLVKGTLKQIKTYFENSLHRKYPGSEVQFSETIINTVVLTHFSAIQTVIAKADNDDSITFKACRVEEEPANLDEMDKCKF